MCLESSIEWAMECTVNWCPVDNLSLKINILYKCNTSKYFEFEWIVMLELIDIQWHINPRIDNLFILTKTNPFQ